MLIIREDRSQRDSDYYHHGSSSHHRRSGSRSRSRSSSRHRGSRSSPHHHKKHSHRSRSRSRSITRKLEVNEIYDGRVRSIMDYGVFIELYDVYPRKEGLCHISNISQSRIRHPSDVVHRDELVKVKITQISGSKISLSMKDVNQLTGEPISQSYVQSSYTTERTPLPPVRRKRVSSSERFEIEQLIASGVMSPQEQRAYLEQYDNIGTNEDIHPEEAIDIQVNDAPAPFIKDVQFKKITMEPTKIIKNPEGSLARAAITGSSMIMERKKLREKQAREDKAKLPEVGLFIFCQVELQCIL